MTMIFDKRWKKFYAKQVKLSNKIAKLHGQIEKLIWQREKLIGQRNKNVRKQYPDETPLIAPSGGAQLLPLSVHEEIAARIESARLNGDCPWCGFDLGEHAPDCQSEVAAERMAMESEALAAQGEAEADERWPSYDPASGLSLREYFDQKYGRQ